MEVDRHRFEDHEVAVDERWDSTVRVDYKIFRFLRILDKVGRNLFLGDAHLFDRPERPNRPRASDAVELARRHCSSPFMDLAVLSDETFLEGEAAA